jgi:catechol 2,3-dioxygenase-like lactoylglutathione lyase family enzyme
MKLKKLTPVLVVAAVEPSLEFWRERLGFAITMEVPHDKALGFAALENDGLEIMLQTRASLASDMSGAASAGENTFLYFEVDDLGAIIAKLQGAPIVVERRTAPYGAEEIAYREPGGHVVCFAQR